MWKANGNTTTLLLFLDSLSPKTEKLSLEEAMDLSRDRLILELEVTLSKPVHITNVVTPPKRVHITNVVMLSKPV
jgi:hypothetical protein